MKKLLFLLVFLLFLLGVHFCRTRVNMDLVSLFDWLDHHRIVAPLLFILVYVVAAMCLVPTLPFNLGAGVLWGAALGGLYTIVSTTMAAGIAFLVSRYLLRDYLEKKFQHGAWQNLKSKIERNNWKVVAFTRINPAFPTGIINYAYGLTRIPFGTYFWTTLVFISPASLAVSLLGASFGKLYLEGGESRAMDGIVTMSLGVALIAGLWFFRGAGSELAGVSSDSIEGKA